MASKRREYIPLSWKEARHRLKECLEYRLAQSHVHVEIYQPDRIHEFPRFVRWWVHMNLDIYIGAFGASLAVVSVAILGYLYGPTENDSRLSQLVSSIVLISGFFFNLWVMRRRKFSTSKGSDNLKRREISSFLKILSKQEDEAMGYPTQEKSDDGLNIEGSSFNDIHWVYRCHSSLDGTTSRGSWSRIPSLLLVYGDHIAMQIGDTAPANCRLAEHQGQVDKITGVGDRITLDSFGEGTASVLGTLPRGRTTLDNDSDHLLTLCNNMRIFVLLESPLESFLHQNNVRSKQSQVARQLLKIRGRLAIVGLLVFIATSAVLLGRYDESQNLYTTLAIPFLASIGLFPFVGPVCLACMEAIGTARILASYHPVAIRQDEIVSDSFIDTYMLVFRYFIATILNRLNLHDIVHGISRKLSHIGAPQVSALVRIPPASLNLLEKLGVATAFTLVDDELVCEPHAMPQQLLIPSEKGLKLLDLCPNYESDSDSDENETANESRRDKDGEWNDSDSESGSGLENHHHYIHTRRKRRRLLRKVRSKKSGRFLEANDDSSSSSSENLDHEVQFEDPLWWQHLPSLKCIGLACMLIDENDCTFSEEARTSSDDRSGSLEAIKADLVRLICSEQRRMQLGSLARCIGFSTKETLDGERGDISPFIEKERMHVISTARFKESLQVDSHEIRSEESRCWGYLRPDSTSIIVQDARTGSFQLLTVGDPRMVTRMCQQAWQGENATILPLSAHDRSNILETSKSWKLGDLDSTAFSYSPIPPTFALRLRDADPSSRKFYLLDNDPKGESLLPVLRSKIAVESEWPQLFNQIFLGVLGSPVIPRQETESLLSTLQDAGVRFVYFSPRNMRLTKEIASQMGIDVAWNCAISLRPLDHGEEDPHRMVSNYADWDVNAKLPHGIESVRRHLEEVDNVPLLVSLFTDVTKETTMEMVKTFQDYNDTVITVGLAHLPRNSRIFSTADLAVGIDVLTDSFKRTPSMQCNYNALLPCEIDFVAAISGHLCAFQLRGVASLAYMPTILAHGRASLEAATGSALYLIFGYISFAFYIFCSVCSVSTTLPAVPVLWAVLYLQFLLPVIGLPISLSDPGRDSMDRVPPKNDPAVVFGRKEGKTLSWNGIMKAIPPALLPQVMFLICFGELMIQLEPVLLDSTCTPNLSNGEWYKVLRCSSLRGYSGDARDYASAISFSTFVLCTAVTSASFIHRTKSIFEEPPWKKNYVWTILYLLVIALAIAYVYLVVDNAEVKLLPWYSFVLYCTMPFICLLWVEFLKQKDKALLDRAEKLRRLQFETRLGMWSPK